MRLFVAIELPAALRQALQPVLAGLGPHALRDAVARHPPLALELAGGGGFPPGARPRVLWAGIRGDIEGLARLAADVDVAVQALGFPADRLPFAAHVTVGRARRERLPRAAAERMAAVLPLAG